MTDLATRIRWPHAATQGYDPRAVARAYGAPVDRYDGSGVTIGVIELGGAVNYDDLTALGLRASNVETVRVDGGQAVSDGPNGADGEVMLDVEVIARVAPGAHQKVYFAGNDDASFLDAIVQAAAECHVISISWGGPESTWDPRTVKRFAAAFATARSHGVTVFAASGDTGSRDGTSSDVVDYPASDPNVVGCGGTKLVLDSSGARASEVTWDEDDIQSATGGGVSRLFPGRHVPDIAGNADPVTGYQVMVDGQRAVAGGTSAMAPLASACTGLLLQARGQQHIDPRFDFLNSVLTNPAVCFDVVQGDNGGFRAGPGRDDTTGLGVVDFGKLLTILTSGTQVPAPGGGTTTAPTGDPVKPTPPTGTTPSPAPTAPSSEADRLRATLRSIRTQIDNALAGR